MGTAKLSVVAAALFVVQNAHAAPPAQTSADAPLDSAPTEREPRWGLFGVGAGTFVAGYALSGGVALARSRGGDAAWLWAPLIGPSVYGLTSEHKGDLGGVAKLADAGLAIGLTSMQVGGVVMMAFGLIGKRTQRPVTLDVGARHIGVVGAF